MILSALVERIITPACAFFNFETTVHIIFRGMYHPPMAFIINGIGTWHWGKRNIVSREKTCEFCGVKTTIRSFDTTLFFVVFLIPIIPLARRRVIDKCSSCKKYRYLSLAKFNAAKANDIASADAALRSDPTRTEYAVRAMAVAMVYDDKDRFIDLTRNFSYALANDPVFLSHLADAYLHFDMPEQNLGALDTLTKLDPDPVNKRRLAMSLIKLNRPDDARPLIDELLASGDLRFIFSPVVQALSYQEHGRHAEALALLDAAAAKFPTLRDNPEFISARRTAEKHLHTNKPIRSADLHPGKRTTAERPILGRVPMLIAAAVILLIVGGYITTAFVQGTSRRVWLINATSDRYTVDLAGRTVGLLPLTPTPVDISEGTHTITRTGPDGTETITVTIETPFFSRPFNRKEFVVNPDRLGVFVEEVCYYAQYSPQQSPPPRYMLPNLLHTPTGFDYVFEPFPAKITVKGSTGQTKKTRFDILREDSQGVFSAIAGVGAQEDVENYLKRSLQIDPGNPFAFEVAAFILKPEDCTRLIGPWVAKRPVNIAAHTAMQESYLRSDVNYDISKRYAELHKAEPDDPALAYLYGRVARSASESERLYRRAIELPKPPAIAFISLATIQHNRGEFAEALSTLRRAETSLGYTDPDACTIMVQTLCAQGKFDEAIETLRTFDPNPRGNSQLFWTRIALELRAGRPNHASEFFSAQTRGIANDFGTIGRATKQFELIRDDLAGKLASPEEQTEQISGQLPQFFAALTRGQWTIAKEASQDGFSDWTAEVTGHPAASLSMSVAALARDDRTAFDEHRSLWLSELRQGDFIRARFLVEFERSAEAALETLPMLPVAPSSHAMTLAMIAHEYPDSYDRCLKLARQLNHTPGFYQHLVNQAFERLRPEPTEPRERKPAAAPGF